MNLLALTNLNACWSDMASENIKNARTAVADLLTPAKQCTRTLPCAIPSWMNLKI
jgi:hypothetical protein